jgi:hypothetical protein
MHAFLVTGLFAAADPPIGGINGIACLSKLYIKDRSCVFLVTDPVP